VESTFGAMATVSDSHPVVAAEEILVSALAEAGVAADDNRVTTTPAEGHPAEVLMQKAAGAELLGSAPAGTGEYLERYSAPSASTWPHTPPARSSSSNPLADQNGRRSRSDSDDRGCQRLYRYDRRARAIEFETRRGTLGGVVAQGIRRRHPRPVHGELPGSARRTPSERPPGRGFQLGNHL
jgi:hypothetical protein